MREESALLTSLESSAALRRPRIGLQVELHTVPAGIVEVPALPDHRLSIHAGTPVWASCRTRTARRLYYTRGDLDLLPAGHTGAWLDESPATSVVVRLPVSLLDRAAQDLGVDPARANLAPQHQFRDPHVEHVVWALNAERSAGHPNGLLYADSLGTALAVRLLGRYAAQRLTRRGLTQRQQQRLTDYIEDRLGQDLSLLQLAGVAGLSASHFKTLFKQSFGVPVHEYVIQRRVERAKNLLLLNRLPASQVALEAGFAHQSHMARCMRRVLGVRPTDIVRASTGRGGR